MAQKKTPLSDKLTTVDLIVSHYNKMRGDKSKIFTLGGAYEMPSVEVIPTGIATLDYALGIGGIPVGRIGEAWGAEGTGKSSLALTIAAAAQRKFPDKPVLYVDTEQSLDAEYAKQLGVDTSRLMVSQPDAAEDGLSIIDLFAKTGQVSLIVLDSIAALSPRAEIDGQVGDSHMGLVARLMSQALRKINKPLYKNKVTCLFLNQIRSNIGPFSGEMLPGGAGVKFYASWRTRLCQAGKISDQEEIVGIEVEATIKKNKLAPPYRVATMPLIFGKGFWKEACLLDFAVNQGVVDKSGAWYSYNGERLGQGRDNTARALEENQEWREKIYQQAMEKSGLKR